ncbi:MAG: hypothetical protein IJC27_05010 [Lentisphaeria bacterium]|nr:hypothetical protein [Lentisphaeria bacterium]
MLTLRDIDNNLPEENSGTISRLEIAGFYGDHAVFQHGKTAVLRGKTLPAVKVELTVGDCCLAIFSNLLGEFTFRIPPMKPAYGLQLTVAAAGEKVVFEDISFGNVYIAGGQSNMELSMENAIPDAGALDESVLHLVKFFPIPVHTYYGQVSSPEGSWQTASRESLSKFSAIGGFFAAALAKKTGIPIGIIGATYGGVNIESFISEYSLLNSSAYAEETARYNEKVCSLDLDCETFPPSGKLDRAIRDLFPEEPADGGIEAGFCTEKFDDSDWDTMLIPDSWTQAGHNHAGIFYFRRNIKLPSGASSHRFTLHLGAVDKFDRTFVNGIEIGSTGDAYTMEYWNTPRVYEVPENILRDGENTIAIRVLSLYSICADGGLTGPAEDMYLESEDGSIKIGITGKWKFKETFDAGTEGMTCMHNFGQGGCNSLYGFFDSMLRPIEGTALAGALWYQGEANAICTAGIYQELMELLIADWRRNFLDSKLHFYIIQLPDFQPVHRFAPFGTWPLLREAQSMAAKTTGSTLINTIGTGDVSDIHPRNKKEVAERIADYEYARLNGSAVKIPELLSIKAEGNALILKFDQKLDKNSSAEAFVIAGKDFEAFEATAEFVSDDTIKLTSNAVSEPFAVWYAWAENPRGFGLKATSGIAIPPFRAALDNTLPVGKNLID